jgi:hypothetical protein
VRVRAVVARPCVTLQSSVPATTPEFRLRRQAEPCGSLRPPSHRPPVRGQHRDRTQPRTGSSPPRRWTGSSAGRYPRVWGARRDLESHLTRPITGTYRSDDRSDQPWARVMARLR